MVFLYHEGNCMKKLLLFITLISVSLLSPVVLSGSIHFSYQDDGVFIRQVELVVDYDNSPDLEPFIITDTICINKVKTRINSQFWIEELKIPSSYTLVKEAVLVAQDGSFVELVVEMRGKGFKVLLFPNDEIFSVMESIRKSDYFILGTIRNYKISEALVFPINQNGKNKFINECY